MNEKYNLLEDEKQILKIIKIIKTKIKRELQRSTILPTKTYKLEL